MLLISYLDQISVPDSETITRSNSTLILKPHHHILSPPRSLNHKITHSKHIFQPTTNISNTPLHLTTSQTKHTTTTTKTQFTMALTVREPVFWNRFSLSAHQAAELHSIISDRADSEKAGGVTTTMLAFPQALSPSLRLNSPLRSFPGQCNIFANKVVTTTVPPPRPHGSQSSRRSAANIGSFAGLSWSLSWRCVVRLRAWLRI